MFRINLLFWAVLLVILEGTAQRQYSLGTAKDDAGYDHHKAYKIEEYQLVLPEFYSLKEHCSKVGNQLKFPHDVYWAIASAGSIVRNTFSSIYYRPDPAANQLSPYFIGMLWADTMMVCTQDVSLSATIDRLEGVGIPKLVEYVDFCPSSISQEVILRAQENSPPYFFEKVFDREMTNSAKLVRIKTKLTLDQPIVASFHAPPSLEHTLDFWQPKERYSEEFPLHTMIIVGYDDQIHGGSLLVQNSWSPKWGNDGYIWIPYEEISFIRYAYSVADYGHLEGSENAQASVFSGLMEFKLLQEDSVILFDRFNPKGFYHLQIPGQSIKFQINGSFTKPFYLKMYYKSKEEIQLVYPLDKWRSSLFEFSFRTFTLPAIGEHYTIDQDLFGTLFIFISLEDIDQIHFDQIAGKTEDINKILNMEQYAFGREIIWSKDQINFSGRLYEKEIIPLVIGLNFNVK